MLPLKIVLTNFIIVGSRAGNTYDTSVYTGCGDKIQQEYLNVIHTPCFQHIIIIISNKCPCK